jgi:hypothetical protein
LVDYVALIVAPRLSSSGLYNDDYVVSRGLFDPVTTLPALAFVAAMLVIAFRERRRHPLFSFAILWFLGGHAIESTVVALEIYFEHRNYVPLFGPAFAIAHAAIGAPGKLAKPARVGILAWLVLAGGIAHLQARAWGSEAHLAAFWHAEHPGSLRAQQQYAQYLLANGHENEARAAMVGLQGESQSAFDVQMQLMTIDCDARRPIDPSRVRRALALASTSMHTPGTALILARLRRSVQAGNCPSQLTPQAWLDLTSAAMRGDNGRGIRRMLRVERAELFLAANQLDAAIAELGHAYGRGKRVQPRVAFYAAALLATAGRYDEAREWASRPLDEPWSWKGWLAQTDRQARELFAAIDASARQKKSDERPQPEP